jgi:hypothetical protein
MLAPRLANTSSFTACGWVSIGSQKAATLAQVGQLCFGKVGHLRVGVDSSLPSFYLPLVLKTA